MRSRGATGTLGWRRGAIRQARGLLIQVGVLQHALHGSHVVLRLRRLPHRPLQQPAQLQRVAQRQTHQPHRDLRQAICFGVPSDHLLTKGMPGTSSVHSSPLSALMSMAWLLCVALYCKGTLSRSAIARYAAAISTMAAMMSSLKPTL